MPIVQLADCSRALLIERPRAASGCGVTRDRDIRPDVTGGESVRDRAGLDGCLELALKLATAQEVSHARKHSRRAADIQSAARLRQNVNVRRRVPDVGVRRPLSAPGLAPEPEPVWLGCSLNLLVAACQAQANLLVAACQAQACQSVTPGRYTRRHDIESALQNAAGRQGCPDAGLACVRRIPRVGGPLSPRITPHDGSPGQQGPARRHVDPGLLGDRGDASVPCLDEPRLRPVHGVP